MEIDWKKMLEHQKTVAAFLEGQDYVYPKTAFEWQIGGDVLIDFSAIDPKCFLFYIVREAVKAGYEQGWKDKTRAVTRETPFRMEEL